MAPVEDVIAGIDHVVIAVPDLDASSAEFEAHGFHVTGREVHENFGTANRLIVLQDTYLELLTVENPDPPVRTSVDILERCIAEGGGVPLIALKPKDLDAAASALRKAGFATEPVRHWSRRARTPDGTFDAEFSTLFFKPSLFPETVAFICKHHTPDRVWHPQWQQHPNGATDLRRIRRYTSSSSGEIAEKLHRVGLMTDCSEQTPSVRLGASEFSYHSEGEPGWCITIATSDCDADVSLKNINGISFELLSGR